MCERKQRTFLAIVAMCVVYSAFMLSDDVLRNFSPQQQSLAIFPF